MNFDDLFDLSRFEHKPLFEISINLWDPIVKLNKYLDAQINSSKRLTLIGRGTDIDPAAKIEGKVIIGKNCKIKEGVLIREGAVIGDSCVVGHACEIKRSIIMDNTNIAHFNYVGDSVIGSGVNFAAGAITANFKHGTKNEIVNLELEGKNISTGLRKFGALVGDGAKIGCNAVLDPGTIIGKNTLIYPLAAIRGTIAANKIVKYRQSFDVVDRI